MSDTGGPAFGGPHPGMTLLDYFAGQAMQALIGSDRACKQMEEWAEEKGGTVCEAMITASYAYAEEMIKKKKQLEAEDA